MTPVSERTNQLRRDSVGVAHVVFFVVAAAAPLSAVIGVTPAAFALGNGPGVPATFLLVGALYLLFSVGFTAMSRFLGDAGGFYPYIVAGLGRPAGVGGAFIAVVTYNAVDLSVYGLFGFFGNSMGRAATGADIPWWAFALLLGVAVYWCGRRNIAFSGRLLGACMLAEISILLLLGLAILGHGGGPEGMALQPFAAPGIFAHGLGLSLVFVVTSFIGFEATVIFGEEARDPRRTIPRATYIAVLLIAVFYAFVSWTIALHYGPSHIAAEAGNNTATLYLTATSGLLGPAVATAMQVLLMTSLFACGLSFHNTINRYGYALAREGVTWSGFARTCPTHQSPHVAGRAQTIFALGMVALLAVTRQDPYAIVFNWSATLCSLGILAVQIMVCGAVVAFFWRDARGLGWWHWLIAPGLSGAGLLACLALMIANLSLVSGSDSPVVRAFPWLIAGVGVLGALFALWLRWRSPSAYRNLGRFFSDDLTPETE
jgi:amino acid transporter